MNFKLAVRYFKNLDFLDFPTSLTYKIAFKSNLKTDYYI